MEKMGRFADIAAISIGFCLMPLPALGDCTLSSSPSGCPFQVQAVIQNGCLVSGSTGTPVFGTLNFGSQPSLSTQTVNASLVSNASYQLNCTPNMSLTMSLDGGQNYNGGRRLARTSGGTLLYQLYSDSTYQSAIQTNQAVTISSVGTGNNITLPIYGRMTLPGNAKPGTYTDTVVVTLSW